MRICEAAVGFVSVCGVGEIVKEVVLPWPPILYYFASIFMLFTGIFIFLSPDIDKSVSLYRTVLSYLAF